MDSCFRMAILKRGWSFFGNALSPNSHAVSYDLGDDLLEAHVCFDVLAIAAPMLSAGIAAPMLI